jgi:hypothetical protein
LCANTAHDMAVEGVSDEVLLARRAALAGGLGDVQAVLPGVLRRQERRCGRAGCRCGRGELHGPYLYLVLSQAGRGRSIYVPGELAEVVDARVAATAAFQAIVGEIEQINVQLLRRRALG